jgi:4-methyl-5(b-hydroxyethyl)-thiazole monophosphate biosynthesis
MAKIIIAIANGFEEIEAVTVIDVCRRAQIEVTIAGVEGMSIEGAHGITMQADCLIEDIDAKQYDMMVLPGGLPNADTLATNEVVQQLLATMKEEHKYIGAICAAPLALHNANVLSKNYTCYPSFEKRIRVNGYNENKDVVIDGKVVTSRGPATAMHFALELVKLLKGQHTFEEVNHQLLAKFKS